MFGLETKKLACRKIDQTGDYFMFTNVIKYLINNLLLLATAANMAQSKHYKIQEYKPEIYKS